MEEVFKKNKTTIILILIFAFIAVLAYVPKTTKAEENASRLFLYDKIIVIGDSRMELIVNKRDYSEKLPDKMEFIAKSGKEITWFNNHAIKTLSEKITKNSDNTAVVINMGVNDLQSLESVDSIASRYLQGFRMLNNLFPNANLYIMSINPIDEAIINDNFKTNKRTNRDIEKINGIFNNYISTSENEKIKYCDAYNTIDFDTFDGLHYTEKTNKKIIDYIINDCIKN